MATINTTNTENNVSTDYHTVIICEDLPEVEKDYTVEEAKNLPSAEFWLNKLDESIDKKRCKVQCTMSNGPYTSSTENHAIFSAFLFAYNSHEDIVLSPDDIWLLICIYFSQYVNENAEQLRSLFVDHEGRQTLTIVQLNLLEPNWDDFLERMQIKICKNIKNDVVELLVANFSTTGKIESFLSCVTMMSTFQKYFEYRCYLTRCGIRKVHFKGTLDDWNSLRKKTEELKKFTIPGNHKFESYVDGLLPIIDQFIETYQSNVDHQFWNKIMDIEHVGMGRSGKMPGTYINGWFLKLCYGLHMKNTCEIRQIKLNWINVPVQVDNEITNESKTCYIAGGFHGVESCDGRHKPVMSLAIMDDTTTIKPLKQV